MFRNYLKIAIRNLVNQKAYSAINIMGLAIGLTACILVGLFVKQEFEYDSYLSTSDNVYRIIEEVHRPSGEAKYGMTPGNLKTTIEGVFPEVKDVARIYFSYDDLVTNGEMKIYEDNIIYADSTFFSLFPYEAVSGNRDDFLKRKNTMVITESMADKYFRNDNPIGKTLILNNKNELEIVGVIKDVPVNSHFKFDFVATYKTLYDTPTGNFIEQWGATFGSYTYLMTYDNVDVKSLGEKITTEIVDKHFDLPQGLSMKLLLQPIEDIHLYSSMQDEIEPTSNVSYIIILSAIAFFIILLACINFVNLTTARAVKRAKEIGIRKVLGAFKHQLIKQFLGESIVVSYLALVVAFVLVEVVSPGFNTLIGTEVSIDYFSNVIIVIVILFTTTFIGFLAGLYPSFVLTHYQPVDVLKGSNRTTGGSKGSVFLRKGLVLFQFTISIGLIVLTLILNKQVDFMRNYDMGFEKEHTIVMETPVRIRDNYEAIKSELNSISGVNASCACLGVPVYDSGYGTNLDTKTENGGESINISVKTIDDDYQNIFNLKLVAGRMLSELTGADYYSVSIVNESLVRKLGYSDPIEVIGKTYRIGLNNFTLEIVGVIEDFHYKSLHEEVTPLIFMRWRGIYQELAVKVSPVNMSTTINNIEKVWNKFFPGYPFTFSFLDEKIDGLYKAEDRSFRVITTFSMLAIFIACLGLLGLTFYSAEQKRKEIGVRKVLGATVSGLVTTITSDFLKLVLIANLVAIPLSYYLANKWLDGFVYRTDIDVMIFVEAGLIALLIAFITIGYTVLRSATANPVEALKYE